MLTKPWQSAHDLLREYSEAVAEAMSDPGLLTIEQLMTDVSMRDTSNGRYVGSGVDFSDWVLFPRRKVARIRDELRSTGNSAELESLERDIRRMEATAKFFGMDDQ